MKLISYTALLVLLGCATPKPAVFGPVPPPLPPRPIRKVMVLTQSPFSVTLAWTAADSTVDGYNVYQGHLPGAYTNVTRAGLTNRLTMDTSAGETSYFTITSTSEGLESDYSNEIGYTSADVEVQTRIVTTQWSTNMINWVDVRRDTNIVSGSSGFWRLKIE